MHVSYDLNLLTHLFSGFGPGHLPIFIFSGGSRGGSGGSLEPQPPPPVIFLKYPMKMK